MMIYLFSHGETFLLLRLTNNNMQKATILHTNMRVELIFLTSDNTVVTSHFGRNVAPPSKSVLEGYHIA